MTPVMAHGSAENGRGGRRSARALPLVRLGLYYAALLAIGAALVHFVPGARDALVAPITIPAVTDLEDLLTGGHPTGPVPEGPWPGPAGRGLLTLTAVLGALALALPVAWVLMYTRRLRYDPSLIHAIIVLPIVVAGVVLVVKNSLALAFALAGIVAGVRFRQKLNEPQEAVYVLLSLGIGLAAGVQALDVALVMSVVFNAVVLVVWRYDVGAIYASGRGALLVTGDRAVLAPPGSAARGALEQRAAAVAPGMDADGIVVVHAQDASMAQRVVDAAVGRVAREWRSTDPTVDEHGLARFEVLLRLRKSADPLELMAELDERCGTHIVAAEYIPFRNRDEEEDE
jgi:hypothetical protein